jgi:hypothetical protein
MNTAKLPRDNGPFVKRLETRGAAGVPPGFDAAAERLLGMAYPGGGAPIIAEVQFCRTTLTLSRW